MKALRLFLLVSLAAALLAGCSSSGGGPAGVAREWLQASLGADGATALKLTCRDYRNDVQTQGLMTAALGLLTGINTENGQIDVSDLKFETIDKSGDTATVRVTGEIIVSLLGAAMAQDIDMTLLMVKEDGDWLVCGQQ